MTFAFLIDFCTVNTNIPLKMPETAYIMRYLRAKTEIWQNNADWRERRCDVTGVTAADFDSAMATTSLFFTDFARFPMVAVDPCCMVLEVRM